MSVTIKDVAVKSGYSITTVSRALNGYDDVNEETRAHIIRTAETLNYQPNRLAQHLVTKRCSALGLFSLDRATFRLPFISEVISGLMDEAYQYDFDVLLFGCQSLSRASEVEQLCLQRGVGGAVIMGLRTDNPLIGELEKSQFPVVLVDVPIRGRRASFVSSDNVEGAAQAVVALAELGHRHIGFINGHRGAWVSLERLRGYQVGLNRCGINWKPEYVFEGDFSKESGRRGARELLMQNRQITALFAASDLMATGAIEAAGAMGYEVPGDISVMGFDDQDFALHTRPALSTVRQDMYRMGREAGGIIVSMLSDSRSAPDHRNLPVEVILRESTGRVPADTRELG